LPANTPRGGTERSFSGRPRPRPSAQCISTARARRSNRCRPEVPHRTSVPIWMSGEGLGGSRRGRPQLNGCSCPATDRLPRHGSRLGGRPEGGKCLSWSWLLMVAVMKGAAHRREGTAVRVRPGVAGEKERQESGRLGRWVSGGAGGSAEQADATAVSLVPVAGLLDDFFAVCPIADATLPPTRGLAAPTRRPAIVERTMGPARCALRGLVDSATVSRRSTRARLPPRPRRAPRLPRPELPCRPGPVHGGTGAEPEGAAGDYPALR
jgi:hypothetical protein